MGTGYYIDLNKACGSDGICSEHLKYASNVLVPY